MGFTGCKKAQPVAEAPTLSSSEAAAEIEVHFLPSTNRASVTIEDRLNGSVHPELTARLRLFADTHGRMPENFYEFANRSMDSVPPLPLGMKFVIDPLDKTVKAVKK
jgi:hypothetical protein